MHHLKELRSLVMGVVVVSKTLGWALLIVLIFMTIWSTLAVEMLHPLMEEVAASNVWEDCERCERSFSSIMAANLTFFQTIIACDSWGRVAIPVIELYPLAAIIFVGSLFSVVVGIFNLIVAVLVDTTAEHRARDTDS